MMNNPVITPKNIFWGTWWSVWQSASSQHGHSRKTKIQDTPNINADKTKIHGSIHWGMYSAWATSGAKSPTIPITTGNTQQKMCGKTVAMIPNFTILFFICFSLNKVFVSAYIHCVHYSETSVSLTLHLDCGCNLAVA